ncbi:hypothetical protein CNMCM6936_007928 [Aspergillus lentulus]|uniref:Mediator of RNA polymerase II transcription subunit 20 n=1 Tax=Aspergillus lentulus TaxID=293939 RepID=A0AAN5YGV8_ASPLE|nr:hypothetical protein CNMCM6069_000522 [Aspergillus lentulus]KAF4165320.1 hypothetical protein CNMCM6936_007928 [Aspergillus lentulus]KAF4201039.1 hypothetical protein CNMCM8927_002201 [Aspergillus lentulus]
MPITGVFFIPANPNASTALATITERLHSAVAEEPVAVGRWALEHKLMRDTPSCVPGSGPQRHAHPRYMQFLSLSYYPNHGFIYTSQTPEKTGQSPAPNAATPQPGLTPASGSATPSNAAAAGGSAMVMSTVPLPSSGALFKHFVYACQPFWCHRHTVAVPGGMVYDVGDFRVRIGDVRQTQPAARVRAQYVQTKRGANLGGATDVSDNDHDSGIDLALFGGIEDADIDAEYSATAALIREFWAKLGIEGAREAILVPDVGREVKEHLKKLKLQEKMGQTAPRNDGHALQQDEDPDPDAGTDLARQFMEIFRFNR